MFTTVTCILGLALGILLIGDLALILSRLRMYYVILPRLRPIDQTHLNIPPVDGLQPITGSLAALGFSRLGEAGLPEHARLSGPVQIWYFADRDKTSVAGLFITDRPHAIIYTWFGDQAVVVTAFPVGDRIEERNYRYHTVSTSLSEAYRHHLAQLPDFKMQFGAPMVVESMTTVLQLDRVYNQKFSRVRGRPTLWRTIGTSLFQVYLIGVLLVTVIAVERFHPPALDVITGMGAAIIFGTGLYWIARQRWG